MADKLIIDCASGERSREPWTDEDEAARQEAAQVVADAEAEAQAAEDAWLDALRNATSVAEVTALLAGDDDETPGRADRLPTAGRAR